jgi:FKBP-type peptidyl-prolyl cis-trans isomerase SlyD
MIKSGSVVSFEYTVSDETGSIIESTKGEEPVTYVHGQHQIIPGLENGLSSMEMNEEKNIRVQPDDGYGPVDPEGFKEIPKTQIPAQGLKVGATLHAQGASGEDVSLRVHEIKNQTVVLDLNHPLAGKTLNFAVKVLDIQPGKAG